MLMKHHDFEPSPLDDETCELCGETYDSAIHEMDGQPDPEERRQREDPPDFPRSVASYFDAAGIRNPKDT